jgi:hypothetical protein
MDQKTRRGRDRASAWSRSRWIAFTLAEHLRETGFHSFNAAPVVCGHCLSPPGRSLWRSRPRDQAGSSDAEAEEFRGFLDAHHVSEENRVVRRIALRGSGTQGIALARTDLIPEVTITAEGVFWHPVGAEDNDLLVSREIFPLADSFAAVRHAFDREHEYQRRLAKIFNCA